MDLTTIYALPAETFGDIRSNQVKQYGPSAPVLATSAAIFAVTVEAITWALVNNYVG